MTGMARALILDLQRDWRESYCQFLLHAGGNGHGTGLLLPHGKVKQYVSLSFTLSIP
jgi:hypothetical protein